MFHKVLGWGNEKNPLEGISLWYFTALGWGREIIHNKESDSLRVLRNSNGIKRIETIPSNSDENTSNFIQTIIQKQE